ncbi:LuxR C-terminal-related transcriptional regulator [Streptomyces sp. NPDC051776]|uniref:LuxR C-terminal-related transcriptional regulator n=1 Tax=Streptomyces sp. NPDC051776 TaxID=3155414 RepID=UPI0034388C56
MYATQSSTDAPAREPPHPPDLWPLTGRRSELRLFRECLVGSRHNAYLIHGDAGTGKTRLADECMEIAVDEGHVSSRAVASTAARTIPLGAIAHLLPSGIDVSDPVSLYDETARHLVAQAGDSRPAVWFVDDLHLLDATSVTLLAQLLETGVLFLVGTVRNGVALSDLVESIERGDRGSRVDLQAWSLEQVETVLHTVLGGPVEMWTAHHLHSTSGGNALYLRELVRGALDSEVLVGEGGVWRLVGKVESTRRLAEIINARIRAVSPAGRAVLDRIAVCGPISVGDLDEELLAGLVELDVVRVRTDRRRMEVDLAHSLYGEVLRSSMGQMQERRILLESIQRLENFGARRREDRLRIVMWQLDATGMADREHLQNALQMARHAQDFASVARLAQALRQLDPGSGPRAIHGEALFELGRFGEADRVLYEAIEAAQEDEELLLAVTLRAQCLAWGALRVDDALDVVQQARARLQSSVADESLRVIEAHLRTFAGEVTQILELLPDVEGMTHPRARIVGALCKACALAEVGRTAEALALTEHNWHEDLPASEAVGCSDPRMRLMVRVQVLCVAGRVEEGRQLGETTYAEVAADRSLIVQTWLALALGKLEFLAGNLQRAHSWYVNAAALASDHYFPGPHWLALSGLALVAAAMGDVGACDKYAGQAQEFRPSGQRRLDVAAVPAWRMAAAGNLSAARNALAEVANLAHEIGAFTTESIHLFSIARLGDVSSVHPRLANLAERSDSLMTGLQAEHVEALHKRCPDQLVSVAKRFEEAGFPLMAADSYAKASEVLTAAGKRRQATVAVTHATRLADGCEGAQGVAAGLTPSPEPLTAREREIALLAVQGFTNKQIAEQLVLSSRTVGNHLYSIYQKLGMANRGELRAAQGTL